METVRELHTGTDLQKASELLAQNDLHMPQGFDHAIGLFRGGQILATGFRKADVLMGLCVHAEYRSEGFAGRMVSALLREATDAGMEHFFLFTKPERVDSFGEMGFTLVAEARPHAAVMEFGRPGIEDWLQQARALLPTPDSEDSFRRAAIVMNANPFTLGHKYLVQRAAQACDELLVFVVQEDASVFPFDTRLRLVRRGVVDIPNCKVLSGGPYMVSRRTFPSYFTGEENHAQAHAALDAVLFARRIAPALGIAERFVGTEPLSAVTRVYNASLQSALPDNGVKLTILDRVTMDDEPVSASRVRALLARGRLDDACRLVPPTTAEFLHSPAAGPVLAQLAQAPERRH